MKNHDEKFKDMIESVLPSTARKSARDRRRLVHKQARARQRIALAAMKGSYDDQAVDFREGRRKAELHWMVLDRRGADNVGALTRWAAAIVEADPKLRDAPLHEQVAYFASIMPADMIGQHAVQHIEWALKYLAEAPYWSERRARWAVQADECKRDMVDALYRLLAAGRHGDLNRALRSVYAERVTSEPEPVEARYLLGQHDVEAFAEATVGSARVRGIVHRLAQS